ncbi:MAG TPA: YbgC/FadM family acyl-CoA thioesterase [Stellaceae bacterium]|jgi:acyl-CoA thioester hydrolase|nr:YbgC/FadM family acyl-CoA thioesterase [Stellaceae bacterium]
MLSAPMLPASGVLDGATHLFPVRVYYEDTDAGGIVYHANYLHFAERARSECLRLLGWPFERLRAETGRAWVVRRAQIDFRLAAKLDDALIVETTVGQMTRAAIELRQIVRRAATILVELRLQLVLVTSAGQLSRIPPMLLDAFKPIFEAAASVFDTPPVPPVPEVPEPGGLSSR